MTFDCYGTLIDWESGIFSALRPILAAHGKAIPDAQLLEIYGELEAQAEQGEFRLLSRCAATSRGWIWKATWVSAFRAEKRSLPESLSNWLPFADTVQALERLKSKFKLAVISNVDDDLFALLRPETESKV